ncbi:unnamed protein product [Prorocentrum cordatum]|uniref:B30.2/SPRY domain-containing protein n=1 Tax=Prorocentrum cordatum TaxID=2364126 RepID=A0ABN9Q0R6_9DINO|nr:unnamed protein product [Polarella glacialis]
MAPLLLLFLLLLGRDAWRSVGALISPRRLRPRPPAPPAAARGPRALCVGPKRSREGPARAGSALRQLPLGAPGLSPCRRARPSPPTGGTASRQAWPPPGDDNAPGRAGADRRAATTRSGDDRPLGFLLPAGGLLLAVVAACLAAPAVFGALAPEAAEREAPARRARGGATPAGLLDGLPSLPEHATSRGATGVLAHLPPAGVASSALGAGREGGRYFRLPPGQSCVQLGLASVASSDECFGVASISAGLPGRGTPAPPGLGPCGCVYDTTSGVLMFAEDGSASTTGPSWSYVCLGEAAASATGASDGGEAAGARPPARRGPAAVAQGGPLARRGLLELPTPT